MTRTCCSQISSGDLCLKSPTGFTFRTLNTLSAFHFCLIHLILDSESVICWFFCQITKSSSVPSSVIPLLKESIGILMQRTPPSLDHALPDCYQRVSTPESCFTSLIRTASDPVDQETGPGLCLLLMEPSSSTSNPERLFSPVCCTKSQKPVLKPSVPSCSSLENR